MPILPQRKTPPKSITKLYDRKPLTTRTIAIKPCKACNGTGKNSKGGNCYPCEVHGLV